MGDLDFLISRFRAHRKCLNPSGVVNSRSGMTLVEVMIVVTIIGILAVIAIPYVRQARRQSQDVAFMNDLRQLSGNVLDYYGFTHGDFPPDSPPGVVPPDLESSLLKRFNWERPPTIGGQWDWDRAPFRGQKVHAVCYACIGIQDPGRTTAEMLAIDLKFDDGSLSAGLFRGIPGGYIYIIEY